jgi:hypothetical protein
VNAPDNAGPGRVTDMQITLLAKNDGPLTKRISLAVDGSLQSDASACVMTRGIARRFQFDGVEELAAAIARLRPNEALALGALRTGLPDQVEIVTKRQLNGADHPGIIARTEAYIDFRPGKPALGLIDYDTKGMPADVAARVAELGGLWPALVSVIPALASLSRIERRSTTSGLYHADTGERLAGSNGQHIYLAVQDGADIERFLKTLHLRCWLAGLGWLMIGAGGQLLERSIVDRVVGSPERLVFEGSPVLVPPLAQDADARRPFAFSGDLLDSVAACPPLTILELARLREVRAKEAARLMPAAAKARKAFIDQQSERLSQRTGLTANFAARVIERQCAGILLPGVELPFDDEDLAGATVADVLADPGRFEDATLADPLEGIEYGTGKAKIMCRADGTVWIHSFAHGRTVYQLRFDHRTAKGELERAPADTAAELFIGLVPAGDLGEDEVEELRNLVHRRTGISKRALSQKLKAARQGAAARHAEEERELRVAARRDPRPQIPAPTPDAPWLPQMDVLNEVMAAATQPEPPMRDIDGVITKVRVRRTPNMHALTALGANEEEKEELRLPPPEQPLLTRLSEAQLAEMIERYIDYVDDTGRSVHLGGAFVHHFHTRDDNELPLAVAVATLPIVLCDGALLAGHGLDRKRGIIFRLPPELSAILPKKENCTTSAVAEAMRSSPMNGCATSPATMPENAS